MSCHFTLSSLLIILSFYICHLHSVHLSIIQENTQPEPKRVAQGVLKRPASALAKSVLKKPGAKDESALALPPTAHHATETLDRNKMHQFTKHYETFPEKIKNAFEMYKKNNPMKAFIVNNTVKDPHTIINSKYVLFTCPHVLLLGCLFVC
jgi:hypothetical protein